MPGGRPCRADDGERTSQAIPLAPDETRRCVVVVVVCLQSAERGAADSAHTPGAPASCDLLKLSVTSSGSRGYYSEVRLNTI